MEAGACPMSVSPSSLSSLITPVYNTTADVTKFTRCIHKGKNYFVSERVNDVMDGISWEK